MAGARVIPCGETAVVRTTGGHLVGDKSPNKPNEKKPGKSLKEKREAKKAKKSGR